MAVVLSRSVLATEGSCQILSVQADQHNPIESYGKLDTVWKPSATATLLLASFWYQLSAVCAHCGTYIRLVQARIGISLCLARVPAVHFCLVWCRSKHVLGMSCLQCCSMDMRGCCSSCSRQPVVALVQQQCCFPLTFYPYASRLAVLMCASVF